MSEPHISSSFSVFFQQFGMILGESSLISLGFATGAIAQPIIPATDATGTVINQQGSEYLITGGTQAGNNLFHSFEQFGLNSGQTANFVGNPDLANILGRVTGGDVSIINGLLQVSNSNANLYLINPAGFVFGSDAQLDVTGSFTATTATQLGFGDEFFNSFGENNYAALTGDPTSFIFDHATGMILNQGNLAVPDSESLWLVGSSVLNLGTISGGNISIVAMPEQRQIKVNGEGSLLSLALDAVPLGGQNLPADINLFKPTDLPKYLTGSETAEELALVDSVVTGDVGIAGLVQGENVQLLAASRVSGDIASIQAGEEGLGGLTVGRFRENLEDSLGYTFIDQRVDNAEQLLFGGQAGTIATIVLQKEAGLAAVTQALLEFAATGQKLDAINIVAEGNQGYFWLGNNLVNGATLETYQAQLQQWRGVLGDGADLLLYSCFTALGMNGEALIQQLADITGADIAASTDITGSENLGGNWQLESKTGEIEANNPFALEAIATWEGKLAVITVNSFLDNLTANGQMTLREALLAANTDTTVEGQTGSGVDEIVFDTSGDFATPRIITTSLGEFVISSDLKITGTGRNNLSIDGNDSNRVFYIDNRNVIIENVTIQNGNSFYGGGIYNYQGNVTIRNTTISNNDASRRGGGIYNYQGNVTIQNSTISNNYSRRDGGGIYNYDGNVTIQNSTISNNATRYDGGGIYNYQGNVTIQNSTITGNSANFDNGGGIVNYGSSAFLSLTDSILSENYSESYGGGIDNSSGTVIVTRSKITGNDARINGGGLANSNFSLPGNMTIIDSTISQNSANSEFGGGIWNRGSNVLTVNRSTFSGNFAAQDGGGIYNSGSATIANSTFSQNQTTDRGGGVANRGSATITNSTFSENSANDGGAGIYNRSGSLVLANTIIANSSITEDYLGSTRASLVLQGKNLVEDGTIIGANVINGDPLLASLGDYGGFTQTHWLLPGSIALDAGDDAVVIGSVDQRGGSRQINTVDLGAVEFQGTTLSVISGNGQSTLINTNFAPLVIAAKETTFANNPLVGLTINLTAPSSGASTTQINFAGVTDANGLVSISPVANALEGSFTIQANTFRSNTVVANLKNVINVIPPEVIPPEVILPEVIPPAVIPSEKASPSELDRCSPNCDNPTNPLPPNPISQVELEVEDIKKTLKKVLEETGIKPALIYAIFKPTASSSIGATNPIASPLTSAGNKDLETNTIPENTTVGASQWEFSGDRLTDALNAMTDHFLNPRETLSGDDELELIMITATGKVIRRPVLGVTRARVMPYVKNFVRGVTNPSLGQAYLAPAQALYDVLVRPLEKDLVEEDIGNLTFVMDDGLRTLPLAALHDGQNFIIENYSVGLMPSFSLTNTSDYVEPKNNLLLVMGSSEFINQADLPAAPLEVSIIEQMWQGDSFVDQQFTVDNLVAARQEKSYGIIHLATHGEFQAGDRSNSFISFADQNIALDELEKLQLGNPPLELLVLSACRTALGDRNAELGFAGLALASGAKSAMGSMWYVSDAGTMGLMTRFYSELQNTPIKAEALRQAQLVLLRGEVHQEGNQLNVNGSAPIQLPPEVAEMLDLDLTHPFYWSAFALVGNPW